jgi:molecular chaperone HscA
MATLEKAWNTTDHRAIKAAIHDLNHASEAFAARRMDRAVSGALTGRRLDEVRTK